MKCPSPSQSFASRPLPNTNTSKMHRSRYGLSVSTMLTAAANLLLPLAILIFAAGFFPYKPLLAGLAHYDNTMQYGQPPPAPFDRVVFMPAL